MLLLCGRNVLLFAVKILKGTPQTTYVASSCDAPLLAALAPSLLLVAMVVVPISQELLSSRLRSRHTAASAGGRHCCTPLCHAAVGRRLLPRMLVRPAPQLSGLRPLNVGQRGVHRLRAKPEKLADHVIVAIEARGTYWGRAVESLRGHVCALGEELSNNSQVACLGRRIDRRGSVAPSHQVHVCTLVKQETHDAQVAVPGCREQCSFAAPVISRKIHVGATVHDRAGAKALARTQHSLRGCKMQRRCAVVVGAIRVRVPSE